MSQREMVFASLDRAFENGYDLRWQHDFSVAVDLCCYDVDFEQIEPAKLVDDIRAWQEARR